MANNMSSKRLTIRYSLYQMIYFAVCAGISSFAMTYLLEKGFQASQVGVILAMTNLLSCILQPLLGDFADRLKTFILPQILMLFWGCSLVCFMIIQMCTPAVGVFGFLYGTGLLLVTSTVSLNNSICAYYTERNYPINYGMGSGIGCISFSFASLGLGYVIAWLGIDWMIWLVLILMLLQIIIVSGYPKLTDSDMRESEKQVNPLHQRTSLWKFFGKYKFFMITMMGVVFAAMCHFMAENYLILIFQTMGGGSENVGTALFLASFSAAPFILCFEKVQKKISILKLMKLAGLFYICKAILLILSTEIWMIYLIQFFHMFTYGFLYPALFYFAKQRIAEADMVKGQAIAAIVYTLGTSAGSFVGGKVIDNFGIDIMLFMALVFAGVGTVIINLSIDRNDLSSM